MPNTKPGEAPRTNYLRPNAKRELEYDQQQCRSQLSETSPHAQVTNRQAVAKRLRKIDTLIESDSAPEIPVSDRPEADRRIKELEVQIRDGMPSRDVMMRNPPGAVGENIKYERRRKPAQLEWKNLMLRRHADSDDPDIANIERLRAPTGSNLSFDGAQIPGRTMSAPSQAFIDNYGAIDFSQGPAAEAIDLAVERRLTDMTASDLETPTGQTTGAAVPKKKARKAKKGRSWTPEQRQAASERFHARQAAKDDLADSHVAQE